LTHSLIPRPSTRQTTSSRKFRALAFALLLAFAGVPALADSNFAPAADAGSDKSGQVGQELTFDAAGSHDPDGDIVAYEWTFGDGSGTAYGEVVRHTFTSANNFTVTLRVQDNFGAWGQDELTVFVCPGVQAAIDATSERGILTLAPCRYTETVVITQPLTLQGGPGVVFDGQLGSQNERSGPVVRIDYTHNVTLQDLAFERWAGYSVRANGAEDVHLTNMTFTNAGATDIRSTSNVELIGVGGTGCEGSYYFANAAGITMRRASDCPAYIQLSAGLRIVDSQLPSTSLYGVDSAVVLDSAITSSLYHYQQTSASEPLVVEDNTIGQLYLDSTAAVRYNTIQSNSNDIRGQDSIVEYNHFASNLYLRGGGTLVRGNSLATTYLEGHDMVVERNAFRSSASYSGDDGIVRYNTFDGDSFTLQSSASDNFVYVNNFFGTSSQDDGYANRWDTGSAGNHWSTHANQDGNGDGIADTPRPIPGNAGATDHYPLATPYQTPVSAAGEQAPDVTSAPDALVGADGSAIIPTDGLVVNTSYDLTFTNLTLSGAGFGYGYNQASTQARPLTLTTPSGVAVDTRPAYDDGLRAGKSNVTFPAALLDERGTWSLRVDGFEFLTFEVSPPYLPATSTENPSGPAAQGVAYDVQLDTTVVPFGVPLRVQTPYDFTLTNLTRSSDDSYDLITPSGTTWQGNVASVVDNLHHGRRNVTRANVTFAETGLWTVRASSGETVGTFEVFPFSPIGAFDEFGLTLGVGLPGYFDTVRIEVDENATTAFDVAEGDIAEPPAPPSSTYLRFFAFAEGEQAHKTRIPRSDSLATPLRIERGDATDANGTVTWSAAAVATIDTRFNVDLIDGATTVDMREATSYNVTLNATHNLTLRLRQAAGLRLDADAVIVAPVIAVGASLNVTATVYNEGPSTAASVSAYLTIDDNTTYVGSLNRTSIPAGQTAQIVFPALTQNVPGAHSARVNVSSTSSETTLTDNVVVKEYFVRETNVRLELLSATTRYVQGVGSTVHTFRVTNDGNDGDLFFINVSGGAPGWSATPSLSQAYLAPGDARNFSVDVQATANAAATRATHTIRVDQSNATAFSQRLVTTVQELDRTLDLPAGWSIVALPVQARDANVSTLFGDRIDAAYEWGGNQSYAASTTMIVGRGYWVHAPNATNVTVTGELARDVTLSLTAGWNLVGPGAVATNLSAAPAHVQRTAFTWNSTSYDEALQLDPGHGYWVYAHGQAASVPLSGTTNLALPDLTPDVDAFVVPVKVASRGFIDAVAFGASSDATDGYDALDIVHAPRAVDVGAIRATWRSVGSPELARSVIMTGAEMTWALVLDTSPDGAVLSWPADAVAAIDAAFRVEIVDGLTRVDMRLTTSYTTTPDTSALEFRVTRLSGDETCVAKVDGACAASTPVDPTRPWT